MGIDSVSGRNRLLGTDASRLPVGVGSPAEIGRLAVTPVGRDCWRNWVRALAVVVLTAVVGLLTTSSAFAVATSGYDASPYAYDAPARLSSPDTVADGRGSPAGTTATSWASPVSVGGRGVAANTARAESIVAESRTYVDLTRGGSIRNVGTNATHTEFAETLTQSGWASRVSSDGAVRIFEQNGARYVLRQQAGSYSGWSADFTPAGSAGTTLKLRLGFE